MSKRFGRNQKRAMRLQISEAEDMANRLRESHLMAEGLISHMSDKLREADDYARQVAKMVDPMCIISRDPKTFEQVSEGDFQLPKYSQALRHDFSEPIQEISKVRAITMHRLHVKSVIDDLNNQLHVRVSLKGKDAGYSISGEALRQAPKDFLVRRISQDVARHLVEIIKSDMTK